MKTIFTLVSISLAFCLSANAAPAWDEALDPESAVMEWLPPAQCSGEDVYLLDSTTNYVWSGTQWVFDIHDVFTYDASGQLTSYIEYAWNGTSWINDRLYTLTWDANGNLITRLRQDWNGTAWVNRYLYDNTFNAQNLRTQSIRSDWNAATGTWNQAVKYTYTYDANGFLIQRIRWVWNGTAWVFDTKYDYTNDAMGFRIQTIVSVWNGAAWVYARKYTYTNNANGDPVQRLRYLWNGTTWLPDQKTDYTYDANGNRTGWTRYDYLNGLWVLQSKKDYFWSLFNLAPTDINLANTLFYQTDPVGTAIGTFSTVDPDDNNHTYTLVAGPGNTSQHNSYFSISGNQLILAQSVANVSFQDFYIFVQTDDGRGGTFCKAFVLHLCMDFQPDIQLGNVQCFGACDGAIQITAVANAAAPVSYDWSTGSQDPSVSGLCPGNYGVTISDSYGCSFNYSFTITQPPALALSLSATDESCYNCNDGSASANANGGTPPYTFLWSTGDTTQAIAGLAPGTYTLTLTDNNGCALTDSVSVLPFACSSFAASGTTSMPSCAGGCDGSIALEASTQFPPLAVQWNTGDTALYLEGLCAGVYSATITDAAGCSSTLNFEVGEPAALAVMLEATAATEGMANGSIAATASGGTPPFQYLWSTGDTSAAISNMPAGWYELTITDQAGCSIVAADSIPVHICTTPALEASVDSVTCFSQCNGAIALELPPSNDGPWSATWSNGAVGLVNEELCAGTYAVTLTDAFGCTSAWSFDIGQPEPLIAMLHTTPSMPGQATGTAWVEPAGGTPPYTFFWSTGDTTQSVSHLPKGAYQVYVFDAHQCFISQFFQIEECAPIQTQQSIMDPSCAGSCDGLAFIDVLTPNAVPVFEWAGGISNTNEAAGLCAGTYAVTITDEATGCWSVDSVRLIEPDPLSIQVVEIVSPTPTNDGWIDVLVEGGTGTYTFVWQDSSGTIAGMSADLQTAKPGCYTLMVTDDHGCRADTTLCLEAVTASSEPANEPLVLLMPNPFSDQLILEWRETGTMHRKPRLRCWHVSGREMEASMVETAPGRYVLDTSRWPAGTYILRLERQPSAPFVWKVVKQ